MSLTIERQKVEGIGQARLKKESETENRNQLGRPADQPLTLVLGMILYDLRVAERFEWRVTRGLN